MTTHAKPMRTKDEKRLAVITAAADTFAQYGFRRTAMNDIARAAGISRPALYLMFENKEDLFRAMVDTMKDAAYSEARAALSATGSWADNFIAAILTYKKVLYAPVANSPHGEELLDVNQSIAADLMVQGHADLVMLLSHAIKDGADKSEIQLPASGPKPKEIVELLLSSIDGVKKSASSMKDFNRQATQLIEIFLSVLKVP